MSTNLCECGCGTPVSRRFAQGHAVRVLSPFADPAVRQKASLTQQRNHGTLARNQDIARRAMAGEAYKDLAAEYGVTFQRVQQIAWANGVPRREHLSGEQHPHWKGGRTTDGFGYVLVKRPEHPRANTEGYVREHILVAEDFLGRALHGHECVHHLNGDRGDNRSENLQVLTRSEHSRLHNRLYSDDLLLDWLRWLALKLNRTPVQDEIRDSLPVWFVTYHDRFGSYSKACHVAGLTPNGSGRPGHGGTTLPLNFRKQYGHLLQYRTPEALADALHGGVATEHARNCAEKNGAAA